MNTQQRFLATREELYEASKALGVAFLFAFCAGLIAIWAGWEAYNLLRWGPGDSLFGRSLRIGIPTTLMVAFSCFGGWIIFELLKEAWRRYRTGYPLRRVWGR